MLISYASDLHLENLSGSLHRSRIQGEVLVLAGDIVGPPRDLDDRLERLFPEGNGRAEPPA
ncbi:MAG: hypothetical protein ACYDBP_00250 [Leptospirales bacterium]